ncbi:transposase-like protein [Desulfohalotomaculum tongense]|uniref:DDE-type integrase/transposase/recombinase n=1 Tax=Desulforadius tongensis TaxID=1216062 RepID=UPI001EE5CCD1|nr:DDE-type integrase/transposase/recombinase [Desulforadius tongensis]MBM7854605.1 transposase-like protein [Desulforadius tongensis]
MYLKSTNVNNLKLNALGVAALWKCTSAVSFILVIAAPLFITKNRKLVAVKINIYNIPDEVLNTVSAVTNGKTDFKRMRYPQQLIIKALRLYFLRKMSTRQIAADLAEEYAIRVSHVTIYKWTVKFSYLFSSIAAHRTLNVSDEWHLDETVVKVAGKKYYLWVALCSETRVVLARHLSPYRDTVQAIRLLRAAIKDLVSNNTLERFMGTFKDWYKKLRGFKSYNSAVALISFWVTCYNFARPHSGLNN